MRHWASGGVALLALAVAPAHAGDKPLIGPVPAWVAPVPDGMLKTLPQPGEVVPLFDEQALVEGDLVTTYLDSAKTIASADDLVKSGTISISWRPTNGDIVFHRIAVLRDGQEIDLLGKPEDFTVLRREAGLENQIVDGRLTAVRHLEGLRIGDTLRLSLSVSERDPVLKGNVQDALLLIASPVRVGFGRVRLVWPRDRAIAWKALAPGIAAAPRSIAGNLSELEIALPLAKLPDMPKNFPSRFQPLPLLTFTSFASWSEVAEVTAPLYRVEGAIAPGSDLAAVVDAIAARSPDPAQRLADALRTAQDEVRYQLMALGTGNYVPQTPAETWAKRYGDCKAKTMLLLAMLDRLGIVAEPVLANVKRGDAVGEMPPGLFAFDHVFVRARIGEEDFWIDGTMLGSRLADIRDIPRYGKVLPVFTGGAGLLELPRRADARPATDIDLAYDMTAGPHLPAPFTLKVRYAASWAEGKRIKPGPSYETELEKFALNMAKTWTDSETIGKPQATFDADAAVWTLSVDGVAYPDWTFENGRYELPLKPLLNVTIDADRGKSAWRHIPALIDQPWTASSRRSIRLPDGGRDFVIEGNEAAGLSLPAVEWTRKIVRGEGALNEEISSRESGGEIPAGEVSAAARTIETEMGRTVRIASPATYPRRWVDAKRMASSEALTKVVKLFDQRIADKPEEADRLSDRGWLASRLFDWKTAEDYYSRAIALDPSAARYASRGSTRELRGDFAGALKDAEQAYDLESGNSEALSLLAVSLAEAGRVDEGLDLVDTDPDVTTDDGLTQFLLRVEVLATGGKRDEVIALLDKAIARHPGLAVLRNNRCWFKALHNTDLDAAMEDCDRSIELSSDPSEAFDSRAMVHYRAGRLKEAEVDLQKALAIAPEQAGSLYMLGIVEKALGNAASGKAQIEAARQVQPGIGHFYDRYGISP